MSPALRLPALPAPPPALRRMIERLPVEPPSWLVAAALNQVLLPRLDREARTALADQAVELCITDFGVRLRLTLGARGFDVAPRGMGVALRIRAPAAAFWRLAAGQEDADTLFFERVLVMEGDTDYGLRLKNTLDAIGPLVPQILRG